MENTIQCITVRKCEIECSIAGISDRKQLNPFILLCAHNYMYMQFFCSAHFCTEISGSISIFPFDQVVKTFRNERGNAL